LGIVVACGGQRPASSVPVPATATGTATGTATATATATPTATGGSVLIGDIAAAKKFAPKATLEENTPALLECYNKVRTKNPALAGKVRLLIQVNEAGAVLHVESEPGGSANEPALVACIGEALKSVNFPKPGGMATIVAPLVFRP
jgi:hypothetical protein